MPVVVLTGPSLYLYVRSLLTDDASLQKKDWFHLLPSLLIFINNIRYYFTVPFIQKLQLAEQIILHDRSLMLQFNPTLFSGEVSYMIRSGAAITYMIVCSILIYRHFKEDFRSKFQNILIFRWLVLLMTFNYVMNISILYYVSKLLYYWRHTPGVTVIPPSALIFGVGSVTLINLTLFFFPSILYGLPRLDYYILNNKSEVDSNTFNDAVPTKEFEISDQKLILIGKKVGEYCVEKPYLQSSFTLAKMSKEVGIPVHHLSYYFNEYLHIDFSTWKNNAKVDFVVELMKNPSNQFLTLDALSKQAGFVSRSTFVNAFKQRMKQTPSEFINSL
jgi:AraC-like DNA-binding protein